MTTRRMTAKRIKSRKAWTKPVHQASINFLEYYTKDELKEITAELVSLYNYSRDWRQSYKTKWTEEYLLYRAYSSYYKNKQKWQSKRFIAEIYRLIETILPETQGAFFDAPPLWTVLPNGEKMVKPGRLTELLLQKRVRQTNYFMTMYLTMKQAMMYGAGIQKLMYEYSPNYVGPKPVALDLFDWFPDPRFSELSEMLFQIHRQIKHIEEIKRMEKLGLYQNVDALDATTGGKEMSSMDRVRVLGYGAGDSNEKTKRFHEVLEYHSKWTDPRTGETFDVIIALADRKTLLRFEETPFQVRPQGAEYYYGLKPFYIFKPVWMTGELYGMSITETVKALQLIINDNENARGDTMKFMQAPVYEAYGPGMVKNKFYWGPGAVIRKNIPGPVLTPVQHDYNLLIAMDQEGERKVRQMKEVTGVQDAFLGEEGNIRKTKAQVLHMSDRTASRLKLIAQIAALTEMPRMAKDMYIMDHEFTSEDVLAEIFDAGKLTAWQKISPKKLVYEGDFETHVSATFGHREQQFENLMNFVQLGAEIEPIAAMLNFDKIVRRAAELLELNPDDVIISEKEKEEAAPEAPPLEAMPGVAPSGTPAPAGTIGITPGEMAALEAGPGGAGPGPGAGVSPAVMQKVMELFQGATG